MRHAVALAAVLTCAGCATAPRPGPPAIEEEQWAMLAEPDTPAPARPSAGEVAAPAPCEGKLPPKPRWPLDDPALSSKDVAAKAQAALKEIELRRAYEAKLEAALKACTQAAARY